MNSQRGSVPHGTNGYKHFRCRCLTCRREESLRVRAAYESACVDCGGPCWGRYSPGRRCAECRSFNRKERSVQPRGLAYQWGCP